MLATSTCLIHDSDTWPSCGSLGKLVGLMERTVILSSELNGGISEDVSMATILLRWATLYPPPIQYQTARDSIRHYRGVRVDTRQPRFLVI